MTFKNREQLIRESLMMSEVDNKISARQTGMQSEIRSMVFMAGNAKPPVEEEKSDSQSQISMDFQQPDASPQEAEVEAKPNKKEMQAVKYVSGGTLVKKNLFSSWLNIYENEANFFGY
jgi:hypothetical protein